MLRAKLTKLAKLRNRRKNADFYNRVFLWEEMQELKGNIMDDIEIALRRSLDGVEL